MTEDRFKPVSTLAGLARETDWVWVWCARAPLCHYHAPTRLAPLIAKWGETTDVARVRTSMRCTRCGHKGAAFTAPSWAGLNKGRQPFPEGYVCGPETVRAEWDQAVPAEDQIDW